MCDKVDRDNKRRDYATKASHDFHEYLGELWVRETIRQTLTGHIETWGDFFKWPPEKRRQYRALITEHECTPIEIDEETWLGLRAELYGEAFASLAAAQRNPGNKAMIERMKRIEPKEGF